MWRFPENKNLMGSVVIKIQSFRQKSLTTLYNRTSGYAPRGYYKALDERGLDILVL